MVLEEDQFRGVTLLPRHNHILSILLKDTEFSIKGMSLSQCKVTLLRDTCSLHYSIKDMVDIHLRHLWERTLPVQWQATLLEGIHRHTMASTRRTSIRRYAPKLIFCGNDRTNIRTMIHTHSHMDILFREDMSMAANMASTRKIKRIKNIKIRIRKRYFSHGRH
jgi:hypothetical protein